MQNHQNEGGEDAGSVGEQCHRKQLPPSCLLPLRRPPTPSLCTLARSSLRGKAEQVLAQLEKPSLPSSTRRRRPPPPRSSFSAPLQQALLTGKIGRHHCALAQLLVPRESSHPCAPTQPAHVASNRRKRHRRRFLSRRSAIATALALTMASPLHYSSCLLPYRFELPVLPCCSQTFLFYLYHAGHVGA